MERQKKATQRKREKGKIEKQKKTLKEKGEDKDGETEKANARR